MEDTLTSTKTPELLEEERKQNAEHAALISKVTLDVEKILLDNNLSMSDYAEVVGTLNTRAQAVFNETPISRIKELYDGHIK